MFCSKCGNELQEGQAFCPKCGNAVNAIPESLVIKHNDSPFVADSSEKMEPGSVIFWVSIILGSLGAHCFMSHRKVRGFLYLVFGGTLYALIKGFMVGFGQNTSVSIVDVVFAGFGIVVLFFNFIDSWKIGDGTFKNLESECYYSGASWMKIVTILVFLLAVVGRLLGIATTMTSYSKEKIKSMEIANVQMELDMYEKLQDAYFSEMGNVGSFGGIGFTVYGSKIFDIQEIDAADEKGLLLTNMEQIGECSSFNRWEILAAKKHRKLFWKVNRPEDKACEKINEKLDDYMDKLIGSNPKEPTEAELRNEAEKDYEDYIQLLNNNPQFADLDYKGIVDRALSFANIADYINNQGRIYLDESKNDSLKKILSKKQVEEFPKLRKEFGKKLGKILWEDDTYISTYGTGNSTIQATNIMFASNMGIKEFDNKFGAEVMLLRFKKVVYMPYKGAFEYSYSSLKTAVDKALVKSDLTTLE